MDIQRVLPSGIIKCVCSRRQIDQSIFQEEYRAKKQNFDEGRAKIPCAPFVIRHALFINNFESIKDAATNLLQEKNFQSVDEK